MSGLDKNFIDVSKLVATEIGFETEAEIDLKVVGHVFGSGINFKYLVFEN